MPKIRVNYKSDLPPVAVKFKINGNIVDVPDHDFIIRFFVDGAPGTSFECAHKGDEYINCAKTAVDTLTCYINNHKFGCGRLCCEFIDLSADSRYSDKVLKTVTPSCLDVVLVEGAGDDNIEVLDVIFGYEINEIASITAEESEEDGGTNVITITETNGEELSFGVKNGHTGNGIASIETTESPESGGVNIVAITETNGTETEFNVLNGLDGVVLEGDPATYIADNLTTDDSEMILSAKQGKVLNDTKLSSEDIGLAEVTLNIKFSLIQNLTDLTSSFDADTVNFGDALTVTLTAESGYVVGICRVTMGGVDITSTAYSNNVVYIAEVTGDVVITAVAAEVGNIPVQFADTAVEAIVLANTTHANPSYITEEEALLVIQIGSGYTQGSWFKGNIEITSFDELGKFGVTSLYEGAFNGCSALESIDISKISALTTRDNIGGTFQNCSSLKKIKTSNTLTKIPINCFFGCSALEIVDFGSSVTSLGDATLRDANNVKTIVLRSTTPPNVGTYTSKRGAKLYVPDDAFDTYQATTWGTYYPAVADSYGTQMLPLSEYVEE